MLYKFDPSKWKDEKLEFEGHVMLRPPTLSEKMRYMEECGVEFDEKGNVQQNKNPLRQMAKMIELSKPHFKEVKITHKKSKKEFKSYDEMSVDPVCDKLITAVSGLVLRGFAPSKN